MKSSLVSSALVLAAILGIGLLSGCATSTETASRDTLTATTGQFPPAPDGITRPRVGVPPFQVKQAQRGFGSEETLDDLAADEMSTLLDQTDRFRVIERTQLQKLLNEQNLEGIVRPGELAQPGQVRGVDYLLIGKVTNLRMKKDVKQRGFGLAQVSGVIGIGGADYTKKDIVVTTECGVDIRLVEPTTGEVWVSNFSEFTRQDKASAFGLDILGASAQADVDLDISDDNKGKILRMALDDALRKSLPKIDRFLKAQPKAGDTSVTAPAGGKEPVAKAFCPQCGKQIAAGMKFCASCGAKVE